MASLPLGWHISGIYCFDDLSIAPGEGPFEDYAGGSEQYAQQALRGLSDRLREPREGASGHPQITR